MLASCRSRPPRSTSTAPVAAGRADLDAHLICVFDLLDTHARRTLPVNGREGDQLKAARTRLWQAADHLHAAYHAAPHPDRAVPGPDAFGTGLPEGAPELTICQRH